MSDLAHYESTFEKSITDHLSQNGWFVGNKDDYNRDLGLDIHELQTFIVGTQKSSWERLISLHGSEEVAWQ
jgi:hypothetical protein